MSDPPSSNPSSYASPPITIILTIVLLLFFFVGFFTIYFCRCFFENLFAPWNFRHGPINLMGSRGGRAGASSGLDQSLIHCFPTFEYSSVKEFRREKYGLECAICLAEFEDDSLLRLITVCCHVFHEECIDLWLSSHKTCPVCRANLDLPLQKLLEKSPDISIAGEYEAEVAHENTGARENVISIDINGEDEEECRRASSDSAAAPSGDAKKFSRSHSTGHSMSNGQEEEKKYTLRLSDRVRVRITRGQTGSSASFEDFTNQKDAGSSRFDELSKENISNV